MDTSALQGGIIKSSGAALSFDLGLPITVGTRMGLSSTPRAVLRSQGTLRKFEGRCSSLNIISCTKPTYNSFTICCLVLGRSRPVRLALDDAWLLFAAADDAEDEDASTFTSTDLPLVSSKTRSEESKLFDRSFWALSFPIPNLGLCDGGLSDDSSNGLGEILELDFTAMS